MTTGNLPAQTQATAAPALNIDPTTGLVMVQGYTAESAADEAAEAAKLGGGGTFFKFKTGANIARILPSIDPAHPSPFYVRHRHWIDLPNGEAVKFNCPQMMGKQHCPLCEKAKSLKANEATKQKGWKMSATRRALAVVIDRTNPDAGPMIMDMPGKKVYDPIVAMRQDTRSGGDFTHPSTGFDLIITRTGTGSEGTDYSVMPDRNNSPLADSAAQINEWLSNMPDMAPYMAVPTAAQIKEMFDKAVHGDATTGSAPAPAPQVGAPVQAQTRTMPRAAASQTAESMVHGGGAAVNAEVITADDIPF